MGAEEKKVESMEDLPIYLKMIMDRSFPILQELGGLRNIAKTLEVDLDNGVDPSTVEWRQNQWGKNSLPPPEEATFWDMVMESLGDRMVQVLIAAAILSLILGLAVPDPHTGEVNYSEGWIEGTAILVSVAIVTFVSAANEFQKEQKFKELSKAKPPHILKVRRGGSIVRISSDQLVQGDVCLIEMGSTVPADGLYVEGQDLKMDQSAITGENIDIQKSLDEDPFIMSGSHAQEGEGWMMVVGVGVNSLTGQAEMKNREKKEPTPLQVKLDDLVETISWLGAGMAFLTFLCLLAKWAYITYTNDGWEKMTNILVLNQVLDALTVAVTIVVVAVPEGLPLSVTIALAYSMKKMMDDQNLVRHLAACETMGGATQICSDKTGTLTQNKMTVVRAVFAGESSVRKLPVPSNPSYRSTLEQIPHELSHDFYAALTEGIVLNSTAYRENGEMKGNKTEGAMLDFITGMGLDFERLREKLNYERTKFQTERYIRTYPFSSAKKRMTTLHRRGKDQRLHVKGASELVLMDCVKQLRTDGKVEDLTEDTRNMLKERITEMARQALRTILIAVADRPGKGGNEFDKEAPEDPLTFVAILAIEDPMRPEVPGAVEECKKAGITVRMVTGDNKATAIAIAKQSGIFTLGEDIAMEGKDFRTLAGNDETSKQRMDNILGKLKVLARMTPIDKQLLVQALRNRGEVVAVTGDGTNDAPALKLANVGFAMFTGTEVAKAASDIILMDDNFASVVTAAMWGRNINDNICKFIQFQSTVNIAAVVIAFLGSVFSHNGESPLKPVQLLWLNLIMDSMAALALATEPPTRSLLNRPPNFAGSPLISRRMWLNMIGQATYQIVLQLWILNFGYEWFGVEENSLKHLTIIFNVFVLLQVVNEFNARKLRNEWNVLSGLTRAPLFLAIIIVTLVVQYLGVQHMGTFMGCTPLTLEEWKLCLLLSSAPLPIGIFLRALPVWEVQPEKLPPPEFIDYRESKGLAGANRFRAAGKEVIQQIKVSASLASSLRRRKRSTSRYMSS